MGTTLDFLVLGAWDWVLFFFFFRSSLEMEEAGWRDGGLEDYRDGGLDGGVHLYRPVGRVIEGSSEFVILPRVR